MTQPNQYNHQERTKGFRKTIEQSYPNMKVSAVLDGKGDELTSKKAAEALLKQNPRIKGIFTTEANGASGVAQAVETAGLKGKVNIIGFDKDKKHLTGLQTDRLPPPSARTHGRWATGRCICCFSQTII
ncbi:substrate-binding domain-containing protein [Bacillus sonorensis]|nr:substrate-binding domain-containing protein [Bacillus sonorensis]